LLTGWLEQVKGQGRLIDSLMNEITQLHHDFASWSCQLTFCLSRDLTYRLTPAPFMLLLRLSGTVSHLMSTHVPLSQHSVNI